MSELLVAGWVRHCECFEILKAMLHQMNLEHSDVQTPYYHISLNLCRTEPNQCIILSCPALIWPSPSEAPSWAFPEIDCLVPDFATHSFAQPTIRIFQSHPESALVLTCDELDHASLALSISVPFSFSIWRQIL